MHLTKSAAKKRKKLKKPTKDDRVSKSTITPTEYKQMLIDVEKWPLTQRIAAELHRNKVTVDEFESAFHNEDYGVSRQVYEHLCQFHLEKGYDPERVTPARPIYLRKISQKELPKPAEKHGRPTPDSGLALVTKFLDQRKRLGWTDGDIYDAVIGWEENHAPPVIKVTVDIDEDEEEAKPAAVKTRTKTVYKVKVRDEWVAATSKKAVELLETKANTYEALKPVEDPATHCWCCKLPLNGCIVRVPQKDSLINVHIGCYYLELTPPTSLIAGFRTMDPKTGTMKTWHPGQTDKGEPGEWRE